MIRRAFIRRMASAAMAGMLGLELLSRSPKVETRDEVVYMTELWTRNGEVVRWIDGVEVYRGTFETPPSFTVLRWRDKENPMSWRVTSLIPK